MTTLDPQSAKKKEAKSKSKKALGKLGLDLASLDLNEHEEIIAGEVVSSDEIKVVFKGRLQFVTCRETEHGRLILREERRTRFASCSRTFDMTD